MRFKCLLRPLAVMLFLLSPTLCFSQVEMNLITDLNLEKAPIDLAFSRDAQWLYVLTQGGDLLVYTYDHQLKGKISVGKAFDRLEAGPNDDEIYLFSRKSNRIRIIEAIPQREINLTGSPYKGNVDAPVVIAEFTDFQCPYCARLGKVFKQLLKQYPSKLKIVYKSYPLANHRYSWKAATNAMAAYEMGKFWEFHDRLFENYNTLDDQKIMEIRKSLGFDTQEFDDLISSLRVRTLVALDRQEGLRLGVRGTPTVFVNGKRLKDKSLEGFKAAIDKELNAPKHKK